MVDKRWKNGFVVKLWFIVVDVKSDNGGNGRKTFVIMGYERGGQYMAYINKKWKLTQNNEWITNQQLTYVAVYTRNNIN
jgi:hypothetical protein